VEFQEILYDVDDRIATITLNRPERMNAFTVRMCHELIAALDRADADDDVRCVIVTGAGKAFCAGADLGSGGGTFDGTQGGSTRTVDTHRDEGGLVALRIFEMKKPVIGAINGAAVGVGITMTLPMDVRIAATGAKIGFVFARRGIVPEAASSWFLPRLVGIARAAEWAYTGRILSADDALAAGLVSRIVEPIEVVATARELAREIAENTSAVSVALTRKLLWTMLGASSPMDAHRIDSKCIFWMGKSPDAYEGVRSFLEKRPPRFAMKPSVDMPPFYPWRPEEEF
jgi:enoyl-CoA hydratase/carnithine racemase